MGSGHNWFKYLEVEGQPWSGRLVLKVSELENERLKSVDLKID